MSLNARHILLLSTPCAGLVIALGVWVLCKRPISLTQQEKMLLDFVPVKATVSQLSAERISGLSCPVSPPAAGAKPAPASYPPVPLVALAPRFDLHAAQAAPAEPAYHLSLVLIDDGRKMAIVNRQVLKEGEAIGAYRVARIEKNRVHLKGIKGELWINLER